MRRGLKALALIAFLAGPMAASADFISVTAQQNITTSGQLFNFSFTSLPTAGTDGIFSITLNGDYSGGSSESAQVTIAGAAGALQLSHGMYYSNVDGLSLESVSPSEWNFDDRQVSVVYSMTDILLNSIIGTGTISVAVQNAYGVNPFNLVNQDFVRVGFAYQSVPEPGTLALFGLGLAGLGFARRRKNA